MKRIAALCIALAASGALAQTKNATDKYFDSLDLDGDGYVSLAEAAGNEEVVKRFDKGDRNHDGKLSRKEFANLKNVKVRVAAKKKEPSAAVGGSAAKKNERAAAGSR
jgi:EF hand